MSELRWYYSEQGVAVGPRSEKDMLDLIKSGKATAVTLIWHAAMEAWEPLEKAQPEWLKAPEPPTQTQPAAAIKKTAPVLVAAVASDSPADKKVPALSPKPAMAPVAAKPVKKTEPAAPEKKGGLLGKFFKR